MGLIRKPVAIGYYPPEKKSLEESIRASFSDSHGAGEIPQVSSKRSKKIIAGVAPHAGFIYSGPIASHLYKAIAIDGFPETFILIGVKHRPLRFPGAALMAEGVWETPIGKCHIDSALAKRIIKQSQDLGTSCILDSSDAHLDEHSIEVQLPFIQFLGKNQDFKILPILISTPKFTICEKVGNAIASAVQKVKRDVFIVASTDFTHYGRYFYGYDPVGSGPVEKIIEWVYETDGDLIHKIEQLDGKALLDTVVKEERTMCGASAVATTITAAKQLGATDGSCLKYATSYDIRGSSEAIVGYASITLNR
ncbi:MAG: AmmeMemoRadiSam system protein B [Candidatus Thorarchaeota archaeon]